MIMEDSKVVLEDGLLVKKKKKREASTNSKLHN